MKSYTNVFFFIRFDKIYGYFEDINRDKYLTLVPTDERKELIKKIQKTVEQIKRSY